LPIKVVDKKKQKLLIDIVSAALNKKSKNSGVENSDLVQKIDQIVYKLYDLTEEEIVVVEGKAR
jgi:hypothetical protein